MAHFYDNWSVRVKFLLVLIVVVLGAFIHSLIVISYLEKLTTTADDIITSRQLEGAVSRLVQIDSSFTAVIELLTGHNDTAALPYYSERMTQYRETLATISGIGFSLENQNRFNEVLAIREKLFVLENEIFERVTEEGAAAGAAILASEEYTALKEELSLRAAELATGVKTEARAYEASRDNLLREVRVIAYGLLLALLLGGSILIYIVSLRLVRTTRDMESVADAIGRGAVGRRVPVQTADEIGRVAVAFNKMAVALDEKEGSSILEKITKEIGQ